MQYFFARRQHFTRNVDHITTPYFKLVYVQLWERLGFQKSVLWNTWKALWPAYCMLNGHGISLWNHFLIRIHRKSNLSKKIIRLDNSISITDFESWHNLKTFLENLFAAKWKFSKPTWLYYNTLSLFTTQTLLKRLCKFMKTRLNSTIDAECFENDQCCFTPEANEILSCKSK